MLSAKTNAAAMLAKPTNGTMPWSVRTTLPKAAKLVQHHQSRASTSRQRIKPAAFGLSAVSVVTLRKAKTKTRS